MINVINGHCEGYEERLRRIFGFHQEVDPMCQPTITDLDAVRIVFFKDDAGGMVINETRFTHKPDVVWRVMMNGFEHHNRGQQRTGKLLKWCENNGFDVQMVEVNNGNELDYWKKHGFKHKTLSPKLALIVSKQPLKDY